jgi:hypothetical protein
MRFLLILTQVETAWGRAPEGEVQRVYERYMEVERDLRAQGKLIESVRLRPCMEARTLRNGPGARRPIEHGPFSDTNEAIGGLYLLECESLDEAVMWAERLPNYGHGSIEIRPVWDP